MELLPQNLPVLAAIGEKLLALLLTVGLRAATGSSPVDEILLCVVTSVLKVKYVSYIIVSVLKLSADICK